MARRKRRKKKKRSRKIKSKFSVWKSKSLISVGFKDDWVPSFQNTIVHCEPVPSVFSRASQGVAVCDARPFAAISAIIAAPILEPSFATPILILFSPAGPILSMILHTSRI
jgi:hypothetical protein